VAAIVDGRVFCVHAGLSPDIKLADQIDLLDRRVEIPQEGALCDLMWSDPEDTIETWGMNGRGAGWLFGSKVAKEFNYINGFKLIARSHQLVEEGYKYLFDESLVIVWSVPNYCYRYSSFVNTRCGNTAAIMKVTEKGEQQFSTFKSVSDTSKIKNYQFAIPYFL